LDASAWLSTSGIDLHGAAYGLVKSAGTAVKCIVTSAVVDDTGLHPNALILDYIEADHLAFRFFLRGFHRGFHDGDLLAQWLLGVHPETDPLAFFRWTRSVYGVRARGLPNRQQSCKTAFIY
jgi:hypothetical protein